MDRITKYDAFDIPRACIYYDSSFNCRGEFTPQSVHELSQSIALRGLDFPLVVQPAADVEGGLPDYHQYRLICGHRRFKAITQFLDWTRIPCTMRGGLTDREARLLNLTENLERRDLNPVEEATAIARLFPNRDATLNVIATELKRSVHWVKMRLDILKFPEDIQQFIAARVLSLEDVILLMRLPENERNEVARRTTRGDRIAAMAPRSRRIRLARKRTEVTRMIERLFEAGITGLPTRLLAWTVGRVSDEDIELEIQKLSKNQTPSDGVEPLDAKLDCRIIWNKGCDPRGDNPQWA